MCYQMSTYTLCGEITWKRETANISDIIMIYFQVSLILIFIKIELFHIKMVHIILGQFNDLLAMICLDVGHDRVN